MKILGQRCNIADVEMKGREFWVHIVSEENFHSSTSIPIEIERVVECSSGKEVRLTKRLRTEIALSVAEWNRENMVSESCCHSEV